MYKTSNPALSKKLFKKAVSKGDSEPMSILGTVNKCAFLGLIAFLSALAVWIYFEQSQNFSSAIFIAIIGAVLTVIVMIIAISEKKQSAGIFIFYAISKGILLGGISVLFESFFPGIIVQATVLTFMILFSLLLIYRFQWINFTENTKLVFAAITMALGLYYLLWYILGRFWIYLPVPHETGFFGIIFLTAMVIIAALNLVFDFDFIENGAEDGAPRHLEWYSAFGLIITLIWLYIEIGRFIYNMIED